MSTVALAVFALSAVVPGCKSNDKGATPGSKPASQRIDAASAKPKTLAASERAASVDAGDMKLPGTLALPAHKAGVKLPGVVLIHGSGPHDRNEKIVQAGFTFEPFAKLSSALVAAGFAVLRYDKRSFVMKAKLAGLEDRAKLLAAVRDLTQQRFTDDARAALKWLGAQPEIDPNKLFIVVHSIAGMYAPQLAKHAKLAGVVMLAPILLPFREHLIHQAEVQRKVLADKLAEVTKAGALTPQTKAAFAKQRAQYDNTIATFKRLFASLDSGTFPAGGMILGGTADMFKQTEKLAEDLPKQYAAMQPPVLYINGKNDWICPEDAVEKHRAELEHKKDLKLVIFDDLNHFQYTNTPLAFSTKMAKTVADWMRKQL